MNEVQIAQTAVQIWDLLQFAREELTKIKDELEKGNIKGGKDVAESLLEKLGGDVKQGGTG